MKYRLQSISTLSIARFGCLLGWVITVIPSLTCGLALWGILVAVGNWFESWERVSLEVLGLEYTADLIELLQLEEFLTTLQVVESRAFMLIVALVILVGVLGGGLIALTLIVLGWGYNLLAWLTGGLELELKEIPTSPALPSSGDDERDRRFSD